MWWAMPWVLAGPFVALLFRTPKRLGPPVQPTADPPFVSIVVPARNEAVNIVRCLESLASQIYPLFEIIVVDDRSEDDTAEIARSVSAGGASRIHVVQGAPLPEGWFGKPWACTQGARAAGGDVLLFTDADTIHEPDLLAKSVGALLDVEASALSVVGRQIMGSFWEGVVQPQVFFLLACRYPNFRKLYDPYMGDPERWRDAIANGQYILIRRGAYDEMGGHETVKGEVVEDLRLAQELVRRGGRLAIRDAFDGLQTRMYRSLSGLVEGWSKNTWTASKQVWEGVSGPLAFGAGAVLLVGLWVVPPLALILGVSGVGSEAVTSWAATVTVASVLFWGAVTWRFGGSPFYALGYPLGAAATALILIRSWRLGDRISWKGRTYGAGGTVDREQDPEGPASVE